MYAHASTQMIVALMQSPVPTVVPTQSIVLGLPGLLLILAVIVVVVYLLYRRFERRSLDRQDTSEASWLHSE